MFVLTTNKELINIEKVMRIYVNDKYINYGVIENCENDDCSLNLREYEGYSIEACADANRGDKCKCIVLEKFAADEKLVAEDVFSQLTFAIDGSPENKIINLADISKRAKYEFKTSKQYEE